MALQSSGAISLANIQTEFGGSNPISLSEYYSAASGVPSSGAISISNFYGTSSVLVATSLTAFSGATVLESGGQGVRWTSNGSWTFTVPGGISSARIHVIGAGGGPGAASGGCGAGAGGGGGYKTYSLTEGGSYTITVGNGGSAGYCQGSSGGSSSFGALITANGGGGGKAGQSGCGFNYRPAGGTISGHTVGSSGGLGGGNHDTNCGVFSGGASSYGGGGGGSANGWGCSCATRGVGGSGGGYGGRGGNGGSCYSGEESGLAYGGGAGGAWGTNKIGAKGVVILQWAAGIKAPGG